MADVTRGQSFSTGSTVTAQKLDNLVRLATISSVSRTSANQNAYSFLTRQVAEVSSAYEKEIWLRQDEYNAPMARISSQWLPSLNQYIPIFNAGTVTLSKGHLVMPFPAAGLRAGGFVDVAILDGSVVINRERCVGVSLGTVAPSSYGVAVVQGLALLRCGEDPIQNGGTVAPHTSASAANIGTVFPGQVSNGNGNSDMHFVTIIGTLLVQHGGTAGNTLPGLINL